jgi:hypothetical protein
LKYLFKGPKKAISAFLFFSKEVRDTIGKDLNNEEFAKRSGEEWKILSEDQKKVRITIISRSLRIRVGCVDLRFVVFDFY